MIRPRGRGAERFAARRGRGIRGLRDPLWSAIIADRDSYQGHRSGNINPLLYVAVPLEIA